MRKVKMIMIPSIGYFMVVPKLGPSWVQFRDELMESFK